MGVFYTASSHSLSFSAPAVFTRGYLCVPELNFYKLAWDQSRERFHVPGIGSGNQGNDRVHVS